MSSTMHDSTFEKLIGTVLEPHEHIDAMLDISKSPLRLQNSQKNLLGESIFLQALNKRHKANRRLGRPRKRKRKETRFKKNNFYFLSSKITQKSKGTQQELKLRRLLTQYCLQFPNFCEKSEQCSKTSEAEELNQEKAEFLQIFPFKKNALMEMKNNAN
jgi:hypothetical protein